MIYNMLNERNKIKFQQMNKKDLNESLIVACDSGKLDIVKYLLTSSDLKENAHIHNNNDEALQITCWGGYLDIIKYLLTSPDLISHANIHANEDSSFINVCEENYFDVVEYLILNYKIKKTNTIDNYLNKTKKEEIIQMFEKRDLEEKLHYELKDNCSTIIPKIKL